jgi:hypothetical protein
MVHPTLWKLDHPSQVRAEKLMYRRFASFDPFLMTGAIVAAFVAARSTARRPPWRCVAPSACPQCLRSR